MAQARLDKKPAPLKKGHISDEVFNRLAEMIFSGELVPGDRFPAEKEWADHFGVSRLIVRQAVHRLAELGMVSVRQGGSSVVMDPSDGDHPSLGVLELQFSPDRKQHVNAFRERQIVGSMGIITLVQRRIKKRDVKELRQLIADYRAQPTTIDDLNEQFWCRIAKIIKNPFLERETRYWFRVIRENPFLQERDTVPDKKRLLAYEALLDELDAGRDPAEAYRVIVDAILTILEKKKSS